jgi:endonuclease III
MFRRFINWLVVRYLTNVDLLTLVSVRLMTKGRDRIVMQQLYTIHDGTKKGEIDYKSFNVLCMDQLVSKFRPRDMMAIMYLAQLRETYVSHNGLTLDPSSDDRYRKLLEAIESAVATPNKLKRIAVVRDLLRENFPLTPEKDLEALAQMAIVAEYTADIAYQYYLNTEKGINA